MFNPFFVVCDDDIGCPRMSFDNLFGFRRFLCSTLLTSKVTLKWDEIGEHGRRSRQSNIIKYRVTGEEG